MELPARYSYPSPGFAAYWQEATGQRMLKKLDEIPDESAVKTFSATYLEGDIDADLLIQDFFTSQGHAKAFRLFQLVTEKGVENAGQIPEELKTFFQKYEQIPDWVDVELLEKGAAFCRRSGNVGALVLRNYCLMGGYESAAINKPLIMTGALEKGAAKRMAETFDFWVDITGKSALMPCNKGYRHALKVRIVHALVRHHLQKSSDWDNHQWGLPLNQGDMIATNLGFSIVFAEGLRKLGIRPDFEEMAGLLHFWKYTGYLLGIPANYLPNTEKEAIRTFYLWTIAQPPADEDTVKLAHSLMNEPLSASFPIKKWQKQLRLELLLAFNYFLMGENACKRIQLPDAGYHFFPPLLQKITQTKEIWTHLSEDNYQRAVENGRQTQLKTRDLFLKSHQK